VSEEPATPKQVAFLRYLGHRSPEKLSKTKASEAISRKRDNKKGEAWIFDRLHLHPELFPDEAPQLGWRRAEYFKTWIMRNGPKGRAKATEKRCGEVIDALSVTDPEWWKKTDRCEVFTAAFMQAFPPTASPDGEPMQVQVPTYYIAKDGENLGEFRAEEIAERLNNFEWSLEDFFFDAASNEWRPLSELEL
jgi:hypothetical protein